MYSRALFAKRFVSPRSDLLHTHRLTGEIGKENSQNEESRIRKAIDPRGLT
jgi:hypothetical protein